MIFISHDLITFQDMGLEMQFCYIIQVRSDVLNYCHCFVFQDTILLPLPKLLNTVRKSLQIRPDSFSVDAIVEFEIQCLFFSLDHRGPRRCRGRPRSWRSWRNRRGTSRRSWGWRSVMMLDFSNPFTLFCMLLHYVAWKV